MKEITSIKNKTISEVKKLKTKKYREQTGTFLAEGYRNVCDSMKKSLPVALFFSEAFCGKIIIPEGCEAYLVTEEVLKELCDTATPQGIVGVFRIPSEQDVSSTSVLLLNGVSDPGNVGTILRTALAAGVTDIVLDEQCADVYSPKVVRSAMSAVFSLNLVRVRNLAETIDSLHQKGYSIYAAALDEKSKELYQTEFSSKTALLFGSEANGIEANLLEKSDCLYIIPMNPSIESLNVAVAAGVSMYELLRRGVYSK